MRGEGEAEHTQRGGSPSQSKQTGALDSVSESRAEGQQDGLGSGPLGAEQDCEQVVDEAQKRLAVFASGRVALLAFGARG